MKATTKSIIFTKSGSVNKNIANAIGHCKFNESERKIYTGYYNGSGKWATAMDASGTIVQILKAQGYKYQSGNDAPKGGITGNFLKVSKTAFDFIRSI